LIGRERIGRNRMIRSWLLILLLGSAGVLPAQAQSSDAAAQQSSQGSRRNGGEDDDYQPPPAPEIKLPMDAVVLTIKGFCPGQQQASGSPCQTEVTRAQFEALASAIQPNMNVVVKRQLASLYPRLLVMSHEAEQRGLDKEPQYQQRMAYSRMQILTQALTGKLQDETAVVSGADIADYYYKHPQQFEVYTLQRLFVPLYKQPPESRGTSPATPAETSQQAVARQAVEAEEMSKLAETLRGRAAAGEDFLTLQKEAFGIAGVKVASPNTSMGKVRRTSIPAAHAAVLQLGVGEVSTLITDSAGHYIYKLEGKEQLPLDKVRDEVRATLSSERLKAALDKIQNSYTAEPNDAYFAPAGGPQKRKPGADSAGKNH
jgi:PPIC-type PPIASE domain